MSKENENGTGGNNEEKQTSHYANLGVSTQKEDVHNAIKNKDKGLFPNAFCKILPDYLAGMPDFCSVMHADGAGTKSSLAYIYWRETGDLSVWKGVVIDAIVMNIDDLLCVGISKNILVSLTVGRNFHLIPGEVVDAIINGAEEFLQELRDLGIPIYLSGGETADVGDLVRTIIIDSTVDARIERSKIISNDNIKEGDVIVGLSSFGKAIYENEYNGGMGSNGLTGSRHVLFANYLADKYPESFDPIIKDEAYTGKYKLTDIVPGLDVTVGKLVLSPTRTYAPVVNKVLDVVDRSLIHGMAHCSGGAQTKIMKFVQNKHVIKNNMFDTPILFKMIKESKKMSWKEMYEVFNMGHRFEIYVPESEVQTIMDVSNSFKVDAQIVGRVEDSEKNKLTIESEHGTFVY